MRVSMVLRGGKELVRKFDNMSRGMKRGVLEVAVMAGAKVIEAQAKINVRQVLTVVSGTLSRSITSKVRSSAGLGVTVAIGSSLVYARIHELGGTIVPIHGEFLVFEIDGEVIFARRVTMPARPYLRPAFDAKKGEAKKAIAAAVRAAIAAA